MAAPELNVRANAALDGLYRRHVGDVYRYTYAVLGNHADAEDVTQTTFVNALRALERGDEPRDPSSWLLAISHNIVRQRWRQAATRPAEVELVADVPDSSGEPDVELDELVRALQRIPPAQREALVMREMEGRSYNEIAELLGLTTAALETLLFRARRSLAEELENLVTCQSAELAMSKQLDGRLSRKERRRLDEHLAECDACARLAVTQRRQRKAFKGLAVLPVPVGLALFKGAPAATAATIPTIGVGATGTGTGVGTTGVGATGASAVGAGGAGAAAAGGSLLGGTVAKVAAVVIAGTVATGVGYKGVEAVTADVKPAPAKSAGVGKNLGAAGVAGAPRKQSAAAAKPGATRRSAVTPSGSSSSASTAGGMSAPGGRPLDPTQGEPAGSKDAAGPSAGETPRSGPNGPPASAPPAASAPETTPPQSSPPGTPPSAGTPPSETPGGSPPGEPDASATPATPEAPPAGSGQQSSCPGGGTGPGNGSGCGVANGHETHDLLGEQPPQGPPEQGSGGSSASPEGSTASSNGEPKSGKGAPTQAG